MQETVFTQTRIISEADLDDMQHVNNVVYLRFLQEVAISHWDSLAPREIRDTVKWVVRKHEIEYFYPARLHDCVELVTWVSSAGGVSSERCYEIRLNGKVIVRARTLWIAVDPVTQKPLRISDAVKQLFQLA
ncbi:acyl-CoA thioesterase [Leadbetterella sp. DM7]|uniref:acyl-CoA thioesterase n=1 Tax=Leadbetterella sp. DM7 TaxID=3235085 RepID=UPI00349E883E